MDRIRKRKLIFAAMSFCASIAVSLVLLEILARIIYSQRLDYQIEMSRYALLMKKPASPELSHEHIPGVEAKLMGVDVSINSHGFREHEFNREKKPGVYRIVILGDSLTFGWGVEQKDRFSYLLGIYLAEAYPDRKIEIINTGIGNYNTSQEVALLKARCLDLKPDMVILSYFINDAEPTPSRKDSLLKKYSFLFIWFYGRLDIFRRILGSSLPYEQYYCNLYSEGRPGWTSTKKAFRELASLSEKFKFRLVFVNLPELHSAEPGYKFKDVNRKIREAAEGAGISSYADITPCFVGTTPENLWVSEDDSHPNRHAHAIIAKEIFNHISRSGFLSHEGR